MSPEQGGELLKAALADHVAHHGCCAAPPDLEELARVVFARHGLDADALERKR